MKINKYLLLSLLVVTGKGFAAGQMQQGQMMSGMQTRFVEPVAVEEKLVLINNTGNKLAVDFEVKRLILERQGGQVQIPVADIGQLTITNLDSGEQATISEVKVGKRKHALQKAIDNRLHKLTLQHNEQGELHATAEKAVHNVVNGHAQAVQNSNGKTFKAGEVAVSEQVAKSAMAQAY